MDSKVSKIIEGKSDSNSAQPYLKSSTPGQQDYFVSDSFDSIEVTDAINISSIGPTVAQQQAVDEALNKALQITENDMRDFASELEALSDSLEEEISSRPATDQDWDILYSIHESIGSVYAYISDGASRVSKVDSDNANNNPGRAKTALDFWEQNFAQSSIPFNRYAGKFSVPFPFKSSLEELASVYLGDASLWTDIAALNGLQAPYVDEDGFSLGLISNGSGNIINISGNKNLYVGQTANLNIYKSSENAKLKAYLPFTTNSMKQIYIPTNDVPKDQGEDTKPISFIDDDIEMVKFSKIDLLLDSKYDLAVTSDGFANLAYGKTNLLQAAKLKMVTIAGSKITDANFGGGVEVGESVADLDIDSIIANINSSFEQDDRFEAPSNVNVQINGNSVIMTIFAAVRNNGGVLPITIPLTQ
jgi:hypothetical protein